MVRNRGTITNEQGAIFSDLIGRLDTLNEDKRDTAEGFSERRREIMAEAKASGINQRMLGAIAAERVRERKREEDGWSEDYRRYKALLD